MEHRSILLLEVEAGGQLGETLRRILESCPDQDFELVCHTAAGDDLSQIILRQKPSLILVALPGVQSQSLDVLLQSLQPSSAPIVVVVEAGHEELTRPGVADFIIAPLRDSEVLLRLRRVLNQVTEER